MSASREEIINEIRRLAATSNGQPPGRRLFRRRTNIHPAEWQGVYWTIWSDALKEAGFQPRRHRRRRPDRRRDCARQEAGRRDRQLDLTLERDDFSSNRHPALAFCRSMIFSGNR